MTSIQSGMGIGEPASQGRLFSDPTVTERIPLVDIGARIKAQSRRKEIEEGQVAMAEEPIDQIVGKTMKDIYWQRFKAEKAEREHPDRYTKDLEDMLKGFISKVDWMLRCPICRQPWDRCPADAHLKDCLIVKAKALLERTPVRH